MAYVLMRECSLAVISSRLIYTPLSPSLTIHPENPSPSPTSSHNIYNLLFLRLTMKLDFLALPPELRCMVYLALFADKDEQRFPHSVLNTSREMRSEAAPFLFSTLELALVRRLVCGVWLIALYSLENNSCSKVLDSQPLESLRDMESLKALLPHIKTLEISYVISHSTRWWIPRTLVRFNKKHSVASPNEIEFIDSRRRVKEIKEHYLKGLNIADPHASAINLMEEYLEDIKNILGASSACSMELLDSLTCNLEARDFGRAACTASL